MATINDICKKVGVSKATVSRAISGNGKVKESTREAIFKAMEELNFRPNSFAQALATNRSNSIGLVLPDFDGHYFGSLLKQATQAAEKTGKQLIVTDGHNDAEQEKEAVHFLSDRRCDVIILYSRKLSVEEIIALKNSVTPPIIVVGRSLPEDVGYSISFDHSQASILAVEHLISQGHKRIAYLGPHRKTPTTKLRFSAYQQTLEKHGLELNEDLHFYCENFKLKHGYEKAKDMIAADLPITAIFAASDDIAIGAMKAFREAGYQIPEDISVIGIDNEEVSTYVIPALTTVDLPIQEMTRQALASAQELLEKKELSNRSQTFSGRLIQRESVKKLN